MRSGELAQLAGVTVRALRHYHQVGVLDEPERGSNDYRSYDVHDLVRVLRIKRLASLGISLDRMSGLLNDADEGSSALLDELDSELADRIERLTEQRTLIARLREHPASLDLPPELAPFFASYSDGVPSGMARIDRDHSVLLAHLAGDDAMPQLARFYARLTEPDVLPTVMVLTERFGQLGSGSSEGEVTSLVGSFTETIASVLRDLNDPPLDLGSSADILGEYISAPLNPEQRRVLGEVVEKLGSD